MQCHRCGPRREATDARDCGPTSASNGDSWGTDGTPDTGTGLGVIVVGPLCLLDV